jgi:hypothetical protein
MWNYLKSKSRMVCRQVTMVTHYRVIAASAARQKLLIICEVS